MSENSLEQNRARLREVVYNFRRFAHEHVQTIDYMYLDVHGSDNAMSNRIDNRLADIARAFWAQWIDRPPVPFELFRKSTWDEYEEAGWADAFEAQDPFVIPECPLRSPDVAQMIGFVRRLQSLSSECDDIYLEYSESEHDREFTDVDTHAQVMAYLIAIESLINAMCYQTTS